MAQMLANDDEYVSITPLELSIIRTRIGIENSIKIEIRICN